MLERIIRHAETGDGTSLQGVRHACVYTLSCARTFLRGQNTDSEPDYAMLSLNCLQTLLSVAGSHFQIQILLGVENKAGAVATQIAHELFSAALKRWSKRAAVPLLLIWQHTHMPTTCTNIEQFQQTCGAYFLDKTTLQWGWKVAYLGVLHAQLQRVLDMEQESLLTQRTDTYGTPLSPVEYRMRLYHTLLFGQDTQGKAPCLPGLLHGHDLQLKMFDMGDWRVREKCVSTIVDLLLSCKRLARPQAGVAATMHNSLAKLFINRCILERVQSVRETITWAWRNYFPDLWDGNTRDVLKGAAFRTELLALMSAMFEAAQEHKKLEHAEKRQREAARRQQDAARKQLQNGKSLPVITVTPPPPRARGARRTTPLHAWKRAKLNLLCIGMASDYVHSRQTPAPKHHCQMLLELSEVLEESGEAPTTAELAVSLQQEEARLKPVLKTNRKVRTPAQVKAREYLDRVQMQLKHLTDERFSPLIGAEMQRVKEELGPELTTDLLQQIELEVASDDAHVDQSVATVESAAAAVSITVGAPAASASTVPSRGTSMAAAARSQSSRLAGDASAEPDAESTPEEFMRTAVRGQLQQPTSPKPDFAATMVRSSQRQF